MLEQALPQGTGMTAGQISFVESGIPGKLICFTELSGFPAPALTPLPTYQAAYRKEATQIPLHTHKRVSQFVQPMQFTQEQYRQFAEDFRLYLHAVALGVLKRRKDGKYEITLEGDSFSIGDEFSVRQSGLDANDRSNLEQQVRIRAADLRDPVQLAVLAGLFSKIASDAYKPRKEEDELGRETSKKRFPHKLAEMLSQEYRGKFEQAAGADMEAAEQRAKALLGAWTTAIEGSSADVYADEVADGRGDKRQVNEAFYRLVGAQASLAPTPGAGMGSIAPPPPGMAMPPPALPAHQYFVAHNGQSLGPYGAQQLQQFLAGGNITRDSMLWREGLTGWMPAHQMVELAQVFTAQAPPLPGAPPPPPVF